MRRIATDVSVVCLSVCVSVCDVTMRYPAKTAGPIEMPFSMWSAIGPSNHVLHGGPDPPMVRGNFVGFPPLLKSIGIACSRVFCDMYHWTVNDAQLLWRAFQHARGRFTKGHGSLGRRCGLLSNYFDLLFHWLITSWIHSKSMSTRNSFISIRF